MRRWVIVEVLERSFLPGYVGVFVEHFDKCFVTAVVGDKASEGEQVPKLPESRPPAHWTGRGPVNEGMFCELCILLFLSFLISLRIVHGWMCE